MNCIEGSGQVQRQVSVDAAQSPLHLLCVGDFGDHTSVHGARAGMATASGGPGVVLTRPLVMKTCGCLDGWESQYTRAKACGKL